jgi:hypothetical protein
MVYRQMELLPCPSIEPCRDGKGYAQCFILPLWLTTVYGPQDEHEKVAFLQELRQLRAG